MAGSTRLTPPEPFQFKNPDGWPKWKRRFQQYHTASGLATLGQEQQVSTLLYCMGEDAEDILNSTDIPDRHKKDYERVLDKFDTYFKVRVNIILERAKFNRRCQKEGESAEEYISALYSLVETCNYGNLKDEMIRDRLVVGIRDATLSEKLELDGDLTLETAKKAIRQKEAVKDHRKQLQEEAGASLNETTKTKKWSRQGGAKGRSTPGAPFPKKKVKPQYTQCTRCGNSSHALEKCPARSAVCHKCGKKGHYGKQCFSKNTKGSSSTSELTMDSVFLGALSTTQKSAWSTEVEINKKKINFKLDTGAEVTAVSEKAYHTLGQPPLKKANRIIYGPAQQKLDVTGQTEVTMTHCGNSSKQTMFVIRNLKNNLLGLPAITALNILKRAESIGTTQLDIKQQFPNVFKGLGTLGEEYHIRLREGAVPYCLYTPRNVPIPLREKVKEELNRMESLGVISKVNEPTQWCAGMVVVPKKSGDVRICVDLKALNDNVLREVYPIPTVDETLAQMAGAKIFSKLDANSGFWQIPLSEDSKQLTTFVTPSGRYCFNKLPFGISSAPELFQKRMSHILEGIKGVLCHMDDVLIFGATKEEHDASLQASLKRLETAGVTLNSAKCEFYKDAVKFLGHFVDKDGIRADPSKTEAVAHMEAPQTTTDLRRFLGMTNQLGKFSPRLAELGQPLRELLSSKNTWTWGPEQERAFSNMKEEITKSTVLAHYDPQAPTKISADASSFGLGAVLLQKNNDEWKPVAYASRSLTETERRYAQIEKEALAATWSCEKFRDYVLGKQFEIETDHKPLVPLLSNKRLDSLPPRVLRFRLRMDKYDFQIKHVPGKLLYTADTLSRAPLPETGNKNVAELREEVEAYIAHVAKQALPAAEQHSLDQYQKKQAEDETCSQVMEYCNSGWPRKHQIQPKLIPYWKIRGSFSVHNRLLLFNERIVIPEPLQKDVLQRIHEGHQGIERCRTRARASVWWPNINQQITEMVQRCQDCAKTSQQRKEPLITTSLPERPWKVIGTDLFELDKKHYLLVVDYFSRYPEVIQLNSTTSAVIINALKSIFSRHGIPDVVRSDNGPQYSSIDFAQFANAYGFQHTTSSPLYPQSNGQAERMVQTAKRLIKEAKDPHLALMSYRSTPLPWCNFSPAELLMGRRIRTTVPQTDRQLTPQWTYIEEFRRLNKLYKGHQKQNFDREHRVKELPKLPDDTAVWITSEAAEPIRGRVVTAAETPRSYVVDTPTGEVRRNRSQLRVIPDTTPPERQPTPTAMPQPAPITPNVIMTRSRTGTEIRPPIRLA